MKLNEMAEEYRAGARAIYGRLAELRETALREPSREERFRLNRRIAVLSGMYRDTCLTALYLEHYYEEKEARRSA